LICFFFFLFFFSFFLSAFWGSSMTYVMMAASRGQRS
jgi:hypothetical protein